MKLETKQNRVYEYHDGDHLCYDNVVEMKILEGQHHLRMEGGFAAIVAPGWRNIDIQTTEAPTSKFPDASKAENWINVNEKHPTTGYGFFVTLYKEDGAAQGLLTGLSSYKGGGRWVGYERNKDGGTYTVSREVVAYLDMNLCLNHIYEVRQAFSDQS